MQQCDTNAPKLYKQLVYYYSLLDRYSPTYHLLLCFQKLNIITIIYLSIVKFILTFAKYIEMKKNEFYYVNYADRMVISNLLYWQEKIQNYLIEFYGGNRINPLGTTFGDCISKSFYLLDYARDNPTMFRGVVSDNMLQAGAIIEYRIGDIYLYEERQQHVLIDIFCSAPWNCLPQPITETRKGSAPWLIADIIEEITSDSSIKGILKVAAIPRAIESYKSIGFEENPDGSREMILTEERALQFLEEYKLRWR